MDETDKTYEGLLASGTDDRFGSLIDLGLTLRTLCPILLGVALTLLGSFGTLHCGR